LSSAHYARHGTQKQDGAAAINLSGVFVGLITASCYTEWFVVLGSRLSKMVWSGLFVEAHCV